MSDETLKHGSASEHTEFEPRDIGVSGIYIFLAGLLIFCALSYFALQGMYSFLERYDRAHQPPQNPLTNPQVETRKVGRADIEKFAEPRLETDERRQLDDVRLQEERRLNSYGWVDEKSGVVRIPIERAMQLVAQRGLPVRPAAANAAAGATPAPGPSNPAAAKKGRQ